MKINRRDFLKTTALTSLYFAGFGSSTFATDSPKKNLVVIMLRGGMDGLCAIPVKGDKNFDKPDLILDYMFKNMVHRKSERNVLLFNHPEFLKA